MKGRTRSRTASESSSSSFLERMGAGVVDSSAVFDSSQLMFCMLPHTGNLHEQRAILSPFTVPLEQQKQQQQSPESSFEDRLDTTHLFCVPRTHSSHVQERAFRNSHFEDAPLPISNFEYSMSSHSQEDSLEQNDVGLEELIDERRTDIFDDDYDEDGGVLESRPMLDNVYSLYRESRFSNLNDSVGGELSSSEARIKGQMEKFELLKAEMTKAANRQAEMRKEKPSCCKDNEEEMRLQELKKKIEIEIELRQDEKEVIEQVDCEDDAGDSSAEGERDTDGHEPGCAEEKGMYEQGQGIEDTANNEETKEDTHALANALDLAHIRTDDVEVIHVDDGEWTDSDLSSDSGSSDSGDCSSDYSNSTSSSIISENQMHSEDGDWISDGLKSFELMGDEEQSDYCDDDGLSFHSYDQSIDLPENTLSFDFREFPADSSISLLDVLVSDVRALMVKPRAAEEEDELEWYEGRDIPTLTQDYELETKHMSRTTVNTESTGCSSQATAESSPVDSFLHDEGTIVTHLSMILLPLIQANDEVKPAEVEDVIDDNVEDVIDDDDIELLSEEVNLDKHEATLSRRKRLLLRFRRGCLMCSENSRYR